MTQPKPYVVITMPAYHAERTLEQTVSAIPAGVADEVILVDDASRDATVEVARGLGLRVHVHPANRGYGGNQKSCYSLALESGADIVVLLHPDYQYEPKAVPLLIAPILAGDADMTFGSRFAGMGDPRAGGMPQYRYLGNRLTTVIENTLLGTHFTEMHSGMRAYTREALRALPFLGYPEGFSFDAALLIDAVSSGLRVVEVPIPTRYTKESSSISIARSLHYVADGCLFATRAALERGRRGARYLPRWRTAAQRVMSQDRHGGDCGICGVGSLVLVRRGDPAAVVTPEDLAMSADVPGLHDDLMRCAECGALAARPPWSFDDVASLYEASEQASTSSVARYDYLRWSLTRIAAFHVGGRSLFDVGGADGTFLQIANEDGWTATGIEPSKSAVAAARDRRGVDLRQGLAEQVALPDGSVDVVTMLDALEHLVDPHAVLSRLRPAIKHGGLLAASVRGRGWIREAPIDGLSRQHLHLVTPTAATVLMRRAGFELVAAERPKRMGGAGRRSSSGEDETLLIARPR